jgi:DNA-binding NarL/FixJ family response regulator
VHVSAILRKLRVTSRTEAAVRAREVLPTVTTTDV